jgi:hypothetical protein
VTPSIVIAIEHQLYFFKDFKPLSRFDLARVQFSADEKKIWEELSAATNAFDFDKIVE